jgi:hypothetical protein
MQVWRWWHEWGVLPCAADPLIFARSFVSLRALDRSAMSSAAVDPWADNFFLGGSQPRGSRAGSAGATRRNKVRVVVALAAALQSTPQAVDKRSRTTVLARVLLHHCTSASVLACTYGRDSALCVCVHLG